MAQGDDITLSEFELEMRRLTEELEAPKPAPAPAPAPVAAPAAPGISGKDFVTAIGQVVKPLSASIGTLDLRTKELLAGSQRIENLANEAVERIGAPVTLPTPPEPKTPEELGQILALLEGQKRVEGANQKLFDALHQELKGYKELFLFEALQKPIIRDMLSLFDDLSAIERQGKAFRKGHETQPATTEELNEFLGNLLMNLENLRVLFMEVFDRLEVSQLKTEKGKIDKRLQKALSVVPTDKPEEDGLVARKVRPGFEWRDRVIRPEDVIIKRYTPGDASGEDGE
jgi:molecular chaperone GrpE (heat shock protein)